MAVRPLSDAQLAVLFPQSVGFLFDRIFPSLSRNCLVFEVPFANRWSSVLGIGVCHRSHNSFPHRDLVGNVLPSAVSVFMSSQDVFGPFDLVSLPGGSNFILLYADTLLPRSSAVEGAMQCSPQCVLLASLSNTNWR